MKIASVGRALPAHYYEQATLTEYLAGVWQGEPGTLKRLRELHGNCGVRGRHLALPLAEYARLSDFSACNAAFVRCATDLGERAAADALSRAGLTATDVDAIFFSTVTGLASPSIDARLCNRMGFRADIRRLPLFGLGCVAGAAAVSRAADYVRGDPAAVALVLNVELCSLTLQRGDHSIANLISSGLFGDGAAAAIVVGQQRAATGPSIVATRSVFYPDTEDVMGWDIGSHGFRIVLSSAVPTVARERLAGDIDAFLAAHGLQRRDVRNWVCHPGGPKVLSALQDGLGLSDAELKVSWANLAERGNLSSVSVLLALGDTIDGDRPQPGSVGIMLAMGPGFCTELLLLRW
jgi:alkylresorcinol/alkylpyrone synthase